MAYMINVHAVPLNTGRGRDEVTWVKTPLILAPMTNFIAGANAADIVVKRGEVFDVIAQESGTGPD